MFEIIPAIDLIDGKCVRLTQGRFDEVTVFSDDPVDMARRWEAEGAQRLHLVDLNGSRVGAPQEEDTVRAIAAAVRIPIELGGGIRTIDSARCMLDAGVGRVIVGTSAALDSDLAGQLFAEFGDAIVLGVDAKDGRVAIKGWEETTSESGIDFAKRMQGLGARRVIYTDVSRDGMLQGANVAAMEQMAKALDIPVIASGGVTSIDDIRRLRTLEPVGLEGAILGKALYAGSLTLNDALEAACK